MAHKTPLGWTFIDHETLGHWDSSIIAMTGVCFISNEELKQGHLNGETTNNIDALINRANSWKFDVKEQARLGRTTTKSAIQFWKEQPAEVYDEVIKPSEDDLSITEIFNLLQAYHIHYGVTLDQTRLVDRKHYDVSKLQHIHAVTLGNDASETKVKLPYNQYAYWECSQMFKLFTNDNYANIPVDSITSPNFKYHHAAHDAALDAYRFIETFAGNETI
ncbi:exonuclease A [Acinetobacter phage SH-Ab 15599]|nr:exonuclease A [Acinetobacter phage SH-Ab 15599]